MSSKQKKNRSFGSSLLLGLTIIVIVVLINGYNVIKNYVEIEREHQKLVNGFNQEEFNKKLIPASSLTQVLKEEFPQIELISIKKNSFMFPSSMETYEISEGTNSFTISIWTHHKGSYLDYSSEKDVEFVEIEGMLESISIVTNKNDFPIDSPILKKLIRVISIGLNRELTVENTNDLTSKFVEDLKPFYNAKGSEYREKASGTVYKHKDIEYFYKAMKPDKYADNLDGYIPVYSVGIYLLSLEEIEPAFKVMYNVKDKY